ncbi:AHH domain-containing protein [Sphingomonas sp. CFBP 8760]|uniref:AHH domain-containing protein n=1 Tax=Sphingomonas sp. CFBP 8760 TaxID=2775282 RepID=UPI001783A72E|nr:AHH domain-containing protein [Sphingomonas sp. CFBP 8760]MBD8546019.1 AHH domain-containing protein [Sphingomonas sp. CFBP 8760]
MSFLAGRDPLAASAEAGLTRIAATAPAASRPVAAGAAMPRGVVRIRGGIWTLLEIGRWIDAWAERSHIDAALRRHGLDRGSAADMLAAAAYVWASVRMPLNGRYWDVPFSGPANTRVAVAVMRYEQAHPGTVVLAMRSDETTLRALDAVVAGQWPQEAMITERTSAVSPTLSAHSARARSLAGILGNQRWQAHHIIPFATVARLPTAVQHAIAASGWQMDSTVNLIPLPANYVAYLMPPNLGAYPYHSGSHSRYDRDVSTALQPVAAGAATMAPAALNAAMEDIDRRFRTALRTNVLYKPRLN